MMAKPKTPRNRAKETIIRLGEEYPGSAKELCARETPAFVNGILGHVQRDRTARA